MNTLVKQLIVAFLKREILGSKKEHRKLFWEFMAVGVVLSIALILSAHLLLLP